MRRLSWVVALLAAAAAAAAGAAVALGGGSATAVDPPGCTVNAVLVNSCRPWFGASANRYPQVAPDSLSQLRYFEARVGRQMEIVHTYHPVGDNALDATDLYFANRPNTYLLTNWKPARYWADAGGSNATVNAGIDSMAASIKTLGDTKIFLVLAHEPENDVTADPNCSMRLTGRAGTPEQYRAMWANVRSRFDAAGVTNVVWVMDYMNNPSFSCLVDDLWPGDNLVDWVVFNGYQRGNTGVSFVNEVGYMYDFLTARSGPGNDYLSKPWGIVEWGINQSTQQNAYLYYRQARLAVEARLFPRLGFYLVWDSGNPDTGDFSHRVAYDVKGVLDPAEQEAFNAFAQSPAFVGAGTPGDLLAPLPPGNPTASVEPDGRVRLEWTAATDDVGVASYDVLRDGAVVGTATGTTFTDPRPVPGAQNTYSVRAVDITGKASDPTEVVVAVPDVTGPSRPSGLSARLVDGKPSLSWTASTDNVGVAGYDVLRNGAVAATTGSTSYVDQDVKAGVSYTYAIQARDAAGNVSALSSSVTRSVPDTTPPSAPASLEVSRSARSATLTWGPASDDVRVAGYVVSKNQTVVARVPASTFQYTVSGLTSGSRYTFKVAARDAAGNVGPALGKVG